MFMIIIKQLRLHLKECFDKGHIEPFPISKKRRIKSHILIEEVYVLDLLCVQTTRTIRWIKDGTV